MLVTGTMMIAKIGKLKELFERFLECDHRKMIIILSLKVR